MKVILRSDLVGLGKRGDIVDVADGHARNYLLPKGLALVATSGAVDQAAKMRRSRDLRAVREQTGIQLDRKQIDADPIKSVGQHTVTASLHADVSFPITVEVVPL
jgi:large subunit ribosomal protein L9